MIRRLALILAITATVLGLGSSAAQAAWQAGNSGSAYAKARSIGSMSAPSANVSGSDVTVSWSAPGGSVPTDYQVERYSAGGGVQTIGANCSGTITGLTCTENSVPAGSWEYTVTPVRQNWTGTESARSSAVNVSGGPPSLSLNTTSFNVLQATTGGQIDDFQAGQTVSYRLDNPTTGTVLAGSITPSPVPANGTATVSVTIPSGISNGSHTVYAVGNAGDQASADITVNTGSGFVATGSFTGNGSDNRAITGLGFNPNMVVVKAVNTELSAMRTDTMPGDNSKVGNTAFVADRIQSLDADGFTLGTAAQVNSNGVSYRWTAYRAQSGLFKTGAYTGNGTSQSPSGLGFSPEYASVISANGDEPMQRYSGMTRAFGFGADTGSTASITALGADGFSVGNSATANTNGITYHYAAFNDVAGIAEINSYTGNGTDNRNITGVGLSPANVMIRANDTGTGRPAVHRPASLAGDATMFYNNTANATNLIQALQPDGFQLGTSGTVNNSGRTYHYLAVKNASPSGSCSSPGSQTVTASADSYVDQSSPAANDGTSSDLYVMSKSGNANRRTLVRFNLPAIPAGCSLSQATLRFFAASAVTGRTIDAYRAGGAWTETGVTWTNAPATAGTGSSSASAAGALAWDVTTQTSAMYSGTNNGYILRDSAEGDAASPEQKYQAREGTPTPQDPSLFVAWN